VVLGIPRGGVPVPFEVAIALGVPLDVILVHKLGVPFQPELAMGAIGEEGVRIVNDDVARQAGVSASDFAAVETREREELARRGARVRGRVNGYRSSVGLRSSSTTGSRRARRRGQRARSRATGSAPAANSELSRGTMMVRGVAISTHHFFTVLIDVRRRQHAEWCWASSTIRIKSLR
jgi:hypothetical protein